MASAPSSPPAYLSDKDALLKRLRRIEGQVRGLSHTVEEDRYCIDIVTQVAAIRAALRALGSQLVQHSFGESENEMIDCSTFHAIPCHQAVGASSSGVDSAHLCVCVAKAKEPTSG